MTNYDNIDYGLTERYLVAEEIKLVHTDLY